MLFHTYATIKGYLRDGLTLGGLVIAAVAFIVVANAAISCFHHVRQGIVTTNPLLSPYMTKVVNGNEMSLAVMFDVPPQGDAYIGESDHR